MASSATKPSTPYSPDKRKGADKCELAFIGIKGLPGTFSGVQTNVCELSTRLVQRGHEVHAYVRPHYTPRHIHDDDGIKLIPGPTTPQKNLDASVHGLISALDTILKNVCRALSCD